jgi:hypothetical protein
MVAHHKSKMAPLTKDFRVDLEEGGILGSEEYNTTNEAAKGDGINNKSQHSSACGSSWFWQKNNDLRKPICLVHPWTGLYVTSVLLGSLGSLYFHLAVEKWLLWIVADATAVIIGSRISVKNLQTFQSNVPESQDENRVSGFEDVQASLIELQDEMKECIETSITNQSNIKLLKVMMESRKKKMALIKSMLARNSRRIKHTKRILYI